MSHTIRNALVYTLSVVFVCFDFAFHDDACCRNVEKVFLEMALSSPIPEKNKRCHRFDVIVSVCSEEGLDIWFSWKVAKLS